MKEGQYDCCLNSFDLFETSSSSASLMLCCHVTMDAGNFQFHSNKHYNNKCLGMKSVVCGGGDSFSNISNYIRLQQKQSFL